jgi:hypothetical protein
LPFLKHFLGLNFSPNFKRHTGSAKGSIEMEEFKSMKKCIEELTFMNNQYEIFKQNQKNQKTKTKKFNNYYIQCLERKQEIKANTFNESESEKIKLESVRPKSIGEGQKRDKSLSSKKSSEVSSVVFDENVSTSYNRTRSVSKNVII